MAKKPASPFGLKVLQHAATFLGVSEHPLGSNHGPQVDKWAMRAARRKGGIPWCACFAWCMAADCGQKLKIPYPASVLSWVLWGYEQKLVVDRPFKGDYVCYSWHGATPHPEDHIGIVEKVRSLPRIGNSRRCLIQTIEGNSGDCVKRQTRWVKQSIDPSDPSLPHVVFIRVF